MTHDFTDDFRFSTTPEADALVSRACHRLLPDCIGVSRATPQEDRAGVDYWIATPRGRLSLDLKLRRRDYRARSGGLDVVIELDGHGSSGWLMKAGAADLLLFATADSHKCALFRTRELRTALLLNLSRWITGGRAREITTESVHAGRTWQNRAVIVDADLLWQAIDGLDGTEWDAAANDGMAA
jgi:hypothetical protein